VNSARLRARKLSNDPKLLIDLQKVAYDLQIAVPKGYHDPLTTVCNPFVSIEVLT
jgi:hypothetical protein